jgi:hypothetical protein
VAAALNPAALSASWYRQVKRFWSSPAHQRWQKRAQIREPLSLARIRIAQICT